MKSEQQCDWQLNVSNPEAPVDLDSISDTVDSIIEDVWFGDPTRIKLDWIEDQFNAEHLAAVLRLTAKFKHIIPGWHACYEKVKNVNEEFLYGIDPNLPTW